MYLILSALILLVSYSLFKKASGSMKLLQLNMVSIIFYYHFVIQSFIGVNLALFYLDNHYLISRLKDYDLRQQAYFVVCYTMIMMPLAMISLNKVVGFEAASSFKTYVRKEIIPVTSIGNVYENIAIIFLCVVAISSVIYIYAHMSSVPFLLLLKGMAKEAAEARIQVSHSFSGNQYVKNILGLGLTPLLTYIIYGYTKLTDIRFYRYLFYSMFVASVLALTYNAAKAPALWFILGFVFLKVLLDGRISRRTLYCFIVVIAVVIVFYYSLTGVQEFSDYSTGPIGRIILGQIAGLFYMLHIFPGIRPFMGVQAFPQFLLNLFDIPFEHIRPARIVMLYVNPTGVEQGVAGVVNTIFTGEAWSVYGWIGLLVAPILVGLIIQLFYIILLKMPKNPLNLGLYTYLCLSWPITGGFVDFLYNPGLWILLLIYFSWTIAVSLPWYLKFEKRE